MCLYDNFKWDSRIKNTSLLNLSDSLPPTLPSTTNTEQEVYRTDPLTVHMNKYAINQSHQVYLYFKLSFSNMSISVSSSMVKSALSMWSTPFNLFFSFFKGTILFCNYV